MNLKISEEQSSDIERAAQLAGMSAHDYVIAAIEAQLAYDAANPTDDELESAVSASVELAAACPVGHEFTLKELAQNTAWWIAMRADRHNAVGIQFKKEVARAGVAEFLGKTGANAAVYRRIESAPSARFDRRRREPGPRR